MFVGRDSEMSALLADLDTAKGGDCRIVMLAGEPGIGKTRLTEELSLAAEAAGVETFWGRCMEMAGSPPFWPWSQVFRELADSVDQQSESSQERGHSNDSDSRLQEVAGLLAGESDSSLLSDSATTRFRLFDSLTTELRNVAAIRPIVVVLEDIHLSDSASLDLLEFAATQLKSQPVLIICTYRDVEVRRGDPLSKVLGELFRHSHVSRLSVQPLERSDVEDMVRLIAGVEPPLGLVDALLDRTGSIPLYVKESVEGLIRDNSQALHISDQIQSWNLAVPEGMNDAISRRSSRLSPEATRVLNIATLLGSEFGFRELQACSNDQSQQRTLDIVDEAVEAGLLREVTDSAGNYRFSHALIQQSIREEMRPTERIRIHAQIAGSLETLYGKANGQHASVLAYHFTEAELLMEPEQVAEYNLIAGDQAQSTGAHEDARNYYEIGLSVRGFSVSDETRIIQEIYPDSAHIDDQLALLLAGLGRSIVSSLFRLRTFTRNTGAEYIGRAFHHFASHDDPDQALSLGIENILSGSTQIRHIVDRALDLAPSESEVACRLMIRLCLAADREDNDPAIGDRVFPEAHRIAKKLENKALEMSVVGAWALHDTWNERFDSAIERADQVLSMGNMNMNPRAVAHACESTVAVLFRRGELELALRQAILTFEASLMLGEMSRATLGLRWAVHSATALGKYDIGDKYVNLLIVHQNWYSRPTAIVDRALLHALQGRELLARTDLDSVVKMIESMGRELDTNLRAHRTNSIDLSNVSIAIDSIFKTEKWIETGRAEYQRVTADYEVPKDHTTRENQISAMKFGVISSTDHSRELPETSYELNLLLATVRDDDTPQAAVKLQALHEEFSEGFWIGSDKLAIAIGRSHIFGLLARTAGDFTKCYEYFDEALLSAREQKRLTGLVWTCHDYAETLLDHPNSNASEKIKALNSEGKSISEQIGLLPMIDKFEELELRRAEFDGKTVNASPDGLSARELEVLRELATGKSNREIADALFITQNTVIRHVANIFSKTGCANRAQAAVYAADNGIR